MKQNSGDKNLENFQQIFLTLFLVLELWHNNHYIIHNGSDSHKKSKKITKTTTTISYQRGKINTHRVIIMRQISTEILIFLLTLVYNMHLVLTELFAITRSPEIIFAMGYAESAFVVLLLLWIHVPKLNRNSGVLAIQGEHWIWTHCHVFNSL